MNAIASRSGEPRKLDVLVSALSCNASHGSEGLVGYKTVEALSKAGHRVTLLASPPTEVPPGVDLIPCNAQPCNFNEVGPDAWFRFELRQWRTVRRLGKTKSFDLIHKVTPAPLINSTMLHRHGLPLVIGPVLVAQPVPPSFEPLLRRPVSPPPQMKLHPGRIASSVIRRVAGRVNREARHLDRAAVILLGMKEAWRHIPERLWPRCQLLTWSGIEHTRFVPNPPARNPAMLRLLFVGRLVPYKGLELLLRALAMARKEHPLQLSIVGNGDPVYTEFLRDLASRLGVAEATTFVPAVSRADLLRFYQEADVFCFPTLCDTYGIALLEAMSSSCAVLVSDTAGPQEIVAEGTGLKVPLTNPEQYVCEYAAALVRLAGDAPLRRQLGERAREHILQHHDWERIGQQLLAIYQNIGTQLDTPSLSQ